MIDATVRQAVEKVFDYQPLTRSDVLALYKVAPYSLESYYIQWAAHTIVHEASHGKAYLFGQIGLDANPCPGNCDYCSFAAQNYPWKDKAELPLDIILEYCRVFSENGMHLISLMVTANYDFDQYVNVVSAVRRYIHPNIALMCNLGDFGPEEAEQLKAAGADIIYHAVRIGEGVITGLTPEMRRRTIRSSMDAGLHVASGIDPMYREADRNEVAERSLEIAALNPVFTGVCTLIQVEGTKMADCETLTAEERRIAGAACHLAMGRGKTAFSGNVRWIDAGANPRGIQLLVGEDRIKKEIAQAIQDLTANEWQMADRSQKIWEIYSQR